MVADKLGGHAGYQAIPTAAGWPHPGRGVRRRDRGRASFRRFRPVVFVGRFDPHTPRIGHRGAPRAHHQTGFQAGAVGRRGGHPAPSRHVEDLPSTAPGSSHAAARTSPRSPWHANCSPWLLRAAATGTSARPGPPQSGVSTPDATRARPLHCLTPYPGVVAHLIDPRCCYRTAPCPHQLGEGMTRQPDSIRFCPNVSAHHTWRRTHTYTISPLIFRHPPTSMHRAGQRQDRSSSLRCGRSVLTPALTQCCLPGGRKPAKPLVNNPVDTAPSLQG